MGKKNKYRHKPILILFNFNPDSIIDINIIFAPSIISWNFTYNTNNGIWIFTYLVTRHYINCTVWSGAYCHTSMIVFARLVCICKYTPCNCRRYCRVFCLTYAHTICIGNNSCTRSKTLSCDSKLAVIIFYYTGAWL